MRIPIGVAAVALLALAGFTPAAKPVACEQLTELTLENTTVMAPGVTHCAGGPGPQPDDPLGVLIRWVENGRAPQTLNGVVRDAGGTVTQTRPIRKYPTVATYRGGDTTNASSFVCR